MNNQTDSPYKVTKTMNYEGPRIHSNIEIQNSNNFLPQHHRMDGSVVNKEDYEEYFMSVNQHKKSLRYLNL